MHTLSLDLLNYEMDSLDPQLKDLLTSQISTFYYDEKKLSDNIKLSEPVTYDIVDV